MNRITLVLAVVCVILVITLGGVVAYVSYPPTATPNSVLNLQDRINQLQTWLEDNITNYNSQIAVLQNELISLNTTYNNYIASKQPNGKPSFDIYQTPDFYVFQTFTRITIRNNGTATAHNIEVGLTLTTINTGFLPNHEATQFIPEIAQTQSATIEFPIGTFQLQTAAPQQNISIYEAYIHIQCNELDNTITFHFTHIIS